MTQIAHIGTKRHSGRYAWGSGGHEVLSASDSLKSKGLSELEIAKALGMSIGQLRNQRTLVKAEQIEAKRLMVVRNRESGMSIDAISKESGIPKTTVRSLLVPTANLKFRLIKKVASILAEAVALFKYIDVGEGVEVWLGITRTKLENAITLLRNEGYEIHYLREPQLGTGKITSHMVLAAPGTLWKETHANKSNIQIPGHTSSDGGYTFNGPDKVNNITANRVKVIYGPLGADRDGIVELRPGVPELSLGSKTYSQVRIPVDGTHFIKGVALYGKPKDFPPGVDILVYSSKKPTGNQLDSLKPQKLSDTEPNVFGSSAKPRYFKDADGKTKLSAVNVVYDEGDWELWSRNLSSQILSKQPPALAKQQLDLALSRAKSEFDEISRLTNPTVKAHLLYQFANSMDSDAVDLKAAAMPRQTTSVFIPSLSIKPNEIYAPQYENGTVVSVCRHPFGGRFEAPTLVVNNKNKEAKGLIGNAVDAVALHPSVARQMSGADFDGDAGLIFPNPRGSFKTEPSLKALSDFDARQSYPKFPGMKLITEKHKELQMGIVSNLITDMTIKGASPAEIAAAVRHSMVVIDSYNHELNYQQSYIDNGIGALKKKYQEGGAGTIVSRAGSPVWVNHRKDNYDIDLTTGKKIFTYTEEVSINKKGQEIPKKTKSSKMYEEDDARKLSSGTVIENVYAEHANALKNLGNQARVSFLNVKPTVYNRSAYKVYKDDVDDLLAQLNLAVKHRPLERKAQLVAQEIYTAKKNASPEMTPAQQTKVKNQALNLARARLESPKPLINITPRQWEAIEMGAISQTTLKSVLRNADQDMVRDYATPKSIPPITKGKETRAKSLLSAGYTQAEVSAFLGITLTQVNKIKLS